VRIVEEHEGRSLAERVKELEMEVQAQRRELRAAVQRLDRVTAGQVAEAELRSGQEAWRGLGVDQPENARISNGTRRIGVPPGLQGLRNGEWWFNKIGIGLLLFGAAFLFKFSVDQNWITPSVRVGIGISLGALLVLLGLRVYGERRAFSQVLLGGGVGVFYITGYAAFQLYALVPYVVAFAFMVSVTLLAFLLSLRQEGISLALIGTAGGLGTPFILYDGTSDVGGLVLYTSLILTGACAIYVFKGWFSLLLTAFSGTWVVYLIGYSDLIYGPEGGYLQHRPVMQVGTTFAWVVLGLATAGREVLRSRNPRRWRRPERGALARLFFADEVLKSSVPAHLLSVAAPLVALWFTQEIWRLEETSLGWISLAGAVLYAIIALLVRRVENGGRVHYTQAITALLLATLALVFLLDGDVLLVALAAEAAVLHHLSRRTADRILSVVAHVLSLWVVGWIFARLLDGVLALALGSGVAQEAGEMPLFNLGAFSDLIGLALVLVASLAMVTSWIAVGYRVAVHAALLAWLWHELSMLPNGAAYTTIAWGLYAAALLVIGLRLDRFGLVRAGMATLFLVVGKLFLVDLAGVEAVWRILLFLGFGGLFLVLGYYLQHLWKPATRPPAKVDGNDSLSSGRGA
jgi:uncharacterized membrane protein